MPDTMITMAHGSGGRLYKKLVEEIFLPAFDNDHLRPLTDSALCDCPGEKIAMTTDSFVVRPRFFPGGDIGRLAICGTVNDLAMSGAKPLYVTLGMILEAGLPLTELKLICHSLAAAAREAKVQIVTGDTKVVEKGAGDGIYINTAGVGIFYDCHRHLLQKIARGDAIIISGNIGDHGMAIMAAREKLDFQPPLSSDVAPLNDLAKTLLQTVSEIHAFRDPTRGGVAATLNEWALDANCGIVLDETELPVSADVQAACALLGMDPLYVANEGKMLIALPERYVEKALAACHSHKYGKNARVIGKVFVNNPGLVTLQTAFATERVVDMPEGEQLPRIC